jgi:phosphopantetheine adenylyltransferase
MESYNNKRTISFSPSDKHYAKNTCNLPERIEIPDFTKGKEFILTDIFLKYNEKLKEQSEKIKEYNKLIDNIKELINDVKTIKDVENFTIQMQEIQHIWDSLIVCKNEFKKQLDILCIKYNKETKKYEKI